MSLGFQPHSVKAGRDGATARGFTTASATVPGGRRRRETSPAPRLTILNLVSVQSLKWVYNSADLPNAPVIWAREMDPAHNRELLDYYKDRTVWLVQPDQRPAGVSRYSSEGEPNADSR